MRGRRLLVSVHGDRLLLPPSGGMVDRRTHTHRTRRERARCRSTDPRWSCRCSVPRRSRKSVHLKEFHDTLLEVGCHAIDGNRGHGGHGGRIMPWPSRSTRHSNAKHCKAQPAGNHPGQRDWQCSGGSPATTPDDGTRTATISALPTTKTPTQPIPCRTPNNHKPRVQSPGSRPGY